MTLLVLELHAPARSAIASEQQLIHALAELAPHFLVYGLSFLTLGIFWIGQQTQLNHLEHIDRAITWRHLAFLCAVSLLPFSTALMAEFIHYRTALIIYWANILALGVLLHLTWHGAVRRGHDRPGLSPEIDAAIRRRIYTAQALYGIGLLIGLYSAWWGLGFIVLVQLNYAAAPRIGLLQRL